MFFAVSVPAQIVAEKEQMVYTPKPVPDVSFIDVNGVEHKLSDFKGKVVLLNFWASWCAPCIKEMPELDELQAELGKDKFKVIALSEDGRAPVAEDFYTKHKIRNLELFHDKGSRVFFEMKLRGLPYSIIIDKKGNEAARIEGYIDWSGGARLIIDGLLAQ